MVNGKTSDGNNSEAIDNFKRIIQWKILEEFLVPGKRLMDHLELKSVYKGYITNDHKVRSLEQRWSSEKLRKKYYRYGWNVKNVSCIYIERDYLI